MVIARISHQNQGKHFPEYIKDLADLSGSLVKALELLYVSKGLKKACRLIVCDAGRLRRIKKVIRAYGLSVEISSCRYIIERDGNKTYYTGYSTPQRLTDTGMGFFYLYIARTGKAARLLKICEEHGHERELAEILGYPQCCINFYNKHIGGCVKKKIDFMFITAKYTNTPFPHPFLNNIISRCFDSTLLSHYPCSFNCRASLDIARRRLDFIISLSQALADYLIRCLKSAIIFTPDSGIYQMASVLLKDGEIYFNKAYVSAINKAAILDILMASDRARIVGKKRLILMNKNKILRNFNGNGVNLFIFQ